MTLKELNHLIAEASRAEHELENELHKCRAGADVVIKHVADKHAVAKEWLAALKKQRAKLQAKAG